jgi:hypothetical protein
LLPKAFDLIFLYAIGMCLFCLDSIVSLYILTVKVSKKISASDDFRFMFGCLSFSRFLFGIVIIFNKLIIIY